MGNLTPWELELVTSPIGRMKATFSYGGSAGQQIHRRRGASRAQQVADRTRNAGRKMTVSADMIYPLRQDIFRLRGEVSRRWASRCRSPNRGPGRCSSGRTNIQRPRATVRLAAEARHSSSRARTGGAPRDENGHGHGHGHGHVETERSRTNAGARSVVVV